MARRTVPILVLAVAAHTLTGCHRSEDLGRFPDGGGAGSSGWIAGAAGNTGAAGRGGSTGSGGAAGIAGTGGVAGMAGTGGGAGIAGMGGVTGVGGRGGGPLDGGIDGPIAGGSGCAGPVVLGGLPMADVGFRHVAAASNDFNGDGIADVASINGMEVRVLLGTGNGTLRPPVTYPLGTSANAILAADLNRDGKPDLVVRGTHIGALRGNGDGTFQAFLAGPAVNNVSAGSLNIADLNGDAIPDLLMARNGVIATCLGNGDATFEAPANQTFAGVESFLPSVAPGDFNGDGRVDLVINQAVATSTVLLGNGDGSFQAPRSTPGSGFLISHDFNQDGRLDLAAARGLGSGSNSSVVGVMFGNGDGTFQTAVDHATGGAAARSLVFGDFNGDHKVDLAVGAASGVISVLLGDGAGGFAPSVDNAVGSQIMTIMPGDFDGDGVVDVVATVENKTTLRVLISKGNGSLDFTPLIPIPVQVGNMVGGDFNGDGSIDLLLHGQPANVGSVGPAMFLGRSDGTFAAGGGPFGQPFGGPVAAADVNGDGKLDVLSFSYQTNSVGVSVGDGMGGLPAPVFYPTGNSTVGLALGDFNRDGLVDLAAANSTSNNVAILLGATGGTYPTATFYALGARPAAIVAGDFDEDGRVDLAVATGSATILIGAGDGTFATKPSFAFAGGKLATGDLDHDGHLDLVSTAGIALGNGNGTFKTPVGFPAGSAGQDVRVTDVNNDGRVDVLTTDYGADRVNLLMGRGDGTFDAPLFYHSPWATQPVIGDFNHDGWTDVAVAHGVEAFMTVLLNRRCLP